MFAKPLLSSVETWEGGGGVQKKKHSIAMNLKWPNGTRLLGSVFKKGTNFSVTISSIYSDFKKNGIQLTTAKSRDQGGGWFQVLLQQGITSSMLLLKIINEFVYFLIFLTPY